MTETARRPLLILGTRPFSAEIADVAEAAGFDVTGYVENLDSGRCAHPHQGRPVHWIDDIAPLAATHDAVCGLGTTRRGVFVDQAASLGFGFVTIVHPHASVSPTASLGEGCVVGPGAVIAAHAVLGRHVVVNRGALVGHHARVGDYASIMSGANVAGSCDIGEAVFVAMGAIVLDTLTVGTASIIAAGAVVTRDVPDRLQVMGVPARVVKAEVDRR